MKTATEIFLDYCEERGWEPYPEDDARRSSIIAMIERTQQDAIASQAEKDIVLISDGDSRHALYIDGKLIEDGPDTGMHSVLERCGVKWRYPCANEDWLEEVLYINGEWPKELKDVVLN